MGEFLLIVMSGWLAATAFATTLVVPLGVNALRIDKRPRARFMNFHFVLGVAVPVIALVHVATQTLPRSTASLIQVRSLIPLTALLLLLLQIGLGIFLRRATAARPWLRSAHLATMLVTGTLIAAHILINRAEGGPAAVNVNPASDAGTHAGAQQRALACGAGI